MLTFSITVVKDPESGLTYLYFWGNSDTASALGGYTLNLSLFCMADGQWTTIEPTTIDSLSAWDLFDANLANSTVSAVSAQGLSLDAETNSIGLFRILVPAWVDAGSDLLVWLNESGGDLVFDQNGDPIDISPSLQFWHAALASPQFVEIHTPTLGSPTAAVYSDTSADDNFTDSHGTLVGIDSDGDILTYGISGGTDDGTFVTLIGSYGTLSVTKATGDYTYTTKDVAIEGLKDVASETFVVTVSDGFTVGEATFLVRLAGADDSTMFSGTPTGIVTEDSALTASGTLTVADQDAGDSAITTQSDVAGIYGTFSIGADGKWSYVLSNDLLAVQALKTGQSVTDAFAVVTAGGANTTIAVTVYGANDAPIVASPIPDQTVAQGSTFNYTLPDSIFYDVDTGNAFTYTATLSDKSSLPVWLNFNEETRTFTGTPANADVGYYEVVVTAYDSSNLTVTDTFRITVSNVDDEATGTLVVGGMAQEGGTLSASLSNVEDADGATTTTWQWQISDDGNTDWVNLFSATDAIYTIASDQSQVGKYVRVVATTTDALGGKTTFTGDASGQIANVNDAPLLVAPSAPALFNTTANDTFVMASGTLTATDADNDTLTYGVAGGSVAGGFATLAGIYGSLSVNTTTGAWTYAPDDVAIEAVNINTTDQFTVTVSDGLLESSQSYTVNLIAIPAVTAKYFVLAGSGANYIDYSLNAGNLSLQGQYITEVGTTGVDAIHIRPGVAVDFTLSGASVDKVYFDGNYGDYASYLSGSVMTLVQGGGASQELVRVAKGTNLASSDVLVFSDGSVSTWDLYNLLKSGTQLPNMGAETSLEPQAPAADGSVLTATVKAFSLDSTGETFAPLSHGMHLISVGSIGVDNVYVGEGSSVDATLLGASADNIYFQGDWSDYNKSLSGSVITFKRTTIDGDLETVKVVGGTGALNDKLIFADGVVQSYIAKTALQSNINVAIDAITGYDANAATPTINAIRMGDNGKYAATPEEVDAYLIDASRTLHANLEGFALGDILEFTNIGESSLIFDRGTADDGMATLMAGSATLLLTGLMSDNFSNLSEFQNLYGAEAVLFV